MYGNYPDGMTSFDWDWVYGIVRCNECHHPMKEEQYCEQCSECSHCVIGSIDYYEPTKKYLCETCIERENG